MGAGSPPPGPPGHPELALLNVPGAFAAMAQHLPHEIGTYVPDNGSQLCSREVFALTHPVFAEMTVSVWRRATSPHRTLSGRSCLSSRCPERATSPRVLSQPLDQGGEMRRHLVRRAEALPFALDRERFAAASRDEFGELDGIDVDCEDGIGAALSERFHDARAAGAITGPQGVEVIVYGLEDSLIVALREEEPPCGLPVALRQLATYSFEAKYVVDLEDRSFGEACEAIEELLQRASGLLPSYGALRRGEKGLGPDGRRRRFRALRHHIRRRR